MALAQLTPTKPRRWSQTPPVLQNGDRLALAEFKHLYAKSSKIRRAELLERVVYVASPVDLPHSRAQMLISMVLGTYEGSTSGITAVSEQSVELDSDNEVQPDALLWINGTVDVVGEGLVVGAPTLVVEVAVSTRSYDLGVKKQVYRRNKVQEYLVLAAHEQQVLWFSWEDGVYQPIEADEDGIYRSRAFPGLWLNGAAFWQNDVAGVLGTLNDGLASAEHAAFVTKLNTETK